MTYSQIEAQVRTNINSTTAVVSNVIDDAIYYLSNFFNLKKIDVSQSTVIAQNCLTKPTQCLSVDYLKIGDTVYDSIKESKIEETEKYELKKYIEKDDGKIYIYPTPTAVAPVVLHYRASYTPLAGVARTISDVQDPYLPLMIIIATWFYWLTIAGQVRTQRELYPDMTPKEAQDIAEIWEKHFLLLLKNIKKMN